jgi:transcriptional regulator GlxA family with amidase domain
MNVRTFAIDVLFVVSPHSLLLDIAGPAEAFRLANLHRAERGQPPRFRLRFTGALPGMTSSVGLSLADLEPFPKVLSSPTWVVIVGQPTAHVQQPVTEIHVAAQWLRRTMREHLETAGTLHRLITICSGALVAARAGLFDSRRCTTHHHMLGLLRELAPRARVVDNRVFVVDGPVASSAGITAGIDLALHLIADECGDAVAASVAEDMVVYLRRSPRDPELSPLLVHRRHLHSAVHRVQDAVSSEPQRGWNMLTMAALGHVTERHLLRLFTRHTGVSPMEFLRATRLERARHLIDQGASVARAAELSGFRSGLHLRRAWRRQWGGSPRDAQLAALAGRAVKDRPGPSAHT